MNKELPKGIMFILDGVGDGPLEVLNGQTPLEAASTPNMDKWLEMGMGGMVDPLVPGVPVDTHTGTALLTGVTAGEIGKLRRGPTEAAGAGILLDKGDIALRCNFATVERRGDQLGIVDRRAGRLNHSVVSDLSQCLRDLDLGEGITASVYPATQHRAVLHLTGECLSADVTDSDPMAGEEMVIEPFQALKETAEALRTAKALNVFTKKSHTILSKFDLNDLRKKEGLLQANGVICRGAGQRFEISNILEKLQVKSALLTGDCTIAGLGRILNHTVIIDPEFTALADTNIGRKITMGLKALEEHDLVFIHVKAPDICSHDFDPQAKKNFIERFDKHLTFGFENLVLAVGGDHSTSSRRGVHCGDPVPSLLFSPTGRRDNCREFGESECMLGGLGRISSNTFLLTMLNSMGRLHNYRPDDAALYTF